MTGWQGDPVKFSLARLLYICGETDEQNQIFPAYILKLYDPIWYWFGFNVQVCKNWLRSMPTFKDLWLGSSATSWGCHSLRLDICKFFNNRGWVINGRLVTVYQKYLFCWSNQLLATLTGTPKRNISIIHSTSQLRISLYTIKSISNAMKTDTCCH